MDNNVPIARTAIDPEFETWRAKVENTIAWLSKGQEEQREAVEDCADAQLQLAATVNELSVRQTACTTAVKHLRDWFCKIVSRFGIEQPVDYGSDIRILP